MKFSITISRQMGSQGVEVAHHVGATLGFRVVRRDVINQAARLAGQPDAALAAIDELGLLNLSPTPQACRAYHEAVQNVLVELAAQGGVVIVGRAGQAILSGHPLVFHVRVIAPVETRIQRIGLLQGISAEAARAQVEASDRYRARYMKRYYQVKWEDPGLYDLVVNTERIDPHSAADLIVHALRDLIEQPASRRQENALEQR